MDEKEKYQAKIEARMAAFNDTIAEITTKAKLRKTTQPDIQIKGLVERHERAKDKLKALEQSDIDSWHKFRDELDQLVGGIDEDLRQAMAYFG